jgi:hypothetical protein
MTRRAAHSVRMYASRSGELTQLILLAFEIPTGK